MAKIQTCDNWLAQLLACAILMIYGNSVHVSTLKKNICDIWKAKMFSVIFCQLQTTVIIVECHTFQVCTYYLFPQSIFVHRRKTDARIHPQGMFLSMFAYYSLQYNQFEEKI